MAATTPCIYKSVTLQAGETFVLPPGAELISASSATAITSSCGDDIPVEETKCYKIRWVENTDEEGLTIGVVSLGIGIFVPGNIRIPKMNNAWEDEGGGYIQIVKVSAGGEIKDTSGLGINDFSGLEAAINGLASGSAMTERKYKRVEHLTGMSGLEAQHWPAGFDSGYISYELYFKAIAPVAETVYLEFFGPSDNVGNTPRYYATEIDCADYPADSDISTC